MPYFVYTLRLIVHKDDAAIRTWNDLRTPAKGQKYRVGVLHGSFAQRFMDEHYGNDVEVIPTKEVDETFQLVEDRDRMDRDRPGSPAAATTFRRGRRPKLKVVGAGGRITTSS